LPRLLSATNSLWNQANSHKSIRTNRDLRLSQKKVAQILKYYIHIYWSCLCAGKASKEIESMNLVRPSAEITFMIKKILKPDPKSIHPTTPESSRKSQKAGAGQRSWLSHIIISAHQFPLNLICHLAEGQCPGRDSVLLRSSSS